MKTQTDRWDKSVFRNRYPGVVDPREDAPHSGDPKWDLRSLLPCLMVLHLQVRSTKTLARCEAAPVVLPPFLDDTWETPRRSLTGVGRHWIHGTAMNDGISPLPGLAFKDIASTACDLCFPAPRRL
jgi:hypothetical protein